ncbi:hypothetical protein MWQ93_002431 [Staphylococcus pseudintermedius]|uniref:hypothetical protein n=1 Tax=Staphylococcus pseudintermedius TaxID=283734 RepID=UPI000E2228E5|nr:hypothetical protein [Staphylococcus pseudintermedius]EGQ3260156.1 hypothetical protein [Staphylococcus pseudintermedius]EGQ3422086.1 hypothetical protein [Staphylococcus pseudintermedius]EGQ3672455.1 hypothetical protein [Staphylococcus pseudintermedius]EGQ4065656.1 hypothetical protein [Staphylococcus pseudintermedius]EGQ4470999.1 hypothetical protein [Staphylococcus pseudintermedius]
MEDNQFNIRLIQFIHIYSYWESEKMIANEKSDTLEYLILKCDKLFESLSKISNRPMQEINDFVQKLYEEDIYYNNDIPSSYFLLMTKLMNSIEQKKDDENDIMNIKLDEVNIIQILAIVKAHAMRRLENLE